MIPDSSVSLRFILYFAVILIGILSPGCNQIFNKPEEVAYADVSDAYFLGVDRAKSEDGSGNNLVKLTSGSLEGTPEEVDFMDGNGDVLGEAFAKVEVLRVIVLSPEYTVLWGRFTFQLKDGEIHSKGLLVHNGSGALYDLNDHYVPSDHNCFMGSKYHQQDRSGNIYFNTAGIKRLLIKDRDDIEVEHYLDYPADYRGYFVDPDGRIYFNRGQLLKLAAGGIIETGAVLQCFTGFDGNVYGFQGDESDLLELVKLKVKENTVSKEMVLPTNIMFSNFEEPRYYYPLHDHNYHIFLSNIIDQQRGSDSYPMPFGFVFDEVNQTLHPFQVPSGLSEDMYLFGMEDHYIWIRDQQDQGKFYVIDLESISINGQTSMTEVADYTEFQIPSNLDILDLWFSEKRIIEFYGYDRLAEMHVMGSISMKQGLSYVEKESELGRISLTRIK